jgi:hypothetical protein
VFEYFVGYKLGLTTTPKDYLKKFNEGKPTTCDPRELERRLLPIATAHSAVTPASRRFAILYWTA